MEINEIRSIYKKVLENVEKVIVGKEEVFTLIFTSILARGHVLLEDTPGTGKTTLAKCIAKSVDGDFKRVQFTPDLMPQDITGLKIYNTKMQEFELVKGPLFTNILLADEINRATPRTQSALLEAMEERQITIDGETNLLDKSFFVIATENYIETAGTYPLPEAQLDRFMMKLDMGILHENDEISILKRFITNNPFEEISSVCSISDIYEASECIKNVYVHDSVMDYIVKLSDATRTNNKIINGVSPRASLNLMRASQAFAAISGRDYVIPDDVRYLAKFVFSHRIVSYHGSYGRKENEELITESIKTVTVPVEDWAERN